MLYNIYERDQFENKISLEPETLKRHVLQKGRFLNTSSHLHERVCPSVTVQQKRRFDPGSTLRPRANPSGALIFHFSSFSVPHANDQEGRESDREGIVSKA